MSEKERFLTYSANTEVLQIDPKYPDSQVIATASEVIRQGGLVAFPTETVYGLGANALDSEALARIYLAKQRPTSDPIIAHITTIEQLEQLTIHLPDVAYQLAEAFMPGALTFVLKRASTVPENIATNLDTIAIRMPNHPIAQALIQASGVPIAAPSANTFTRPSATTASHVLEDLNGRVDIILDGGATNIGLESTVLDLTQTTPVVLRPGGITVEQLREVIPNVKVSPRYVSMEASTAESASPGQMIKHYSPNAEVLLFTGELEAVIAEMQRQVDTLIAQGKRVGVLIADEDYPFFDKRVEIKTLGARDDLETISHGLFASLRMLDGLNVDVILVRDFGRSGLGSALWDRLLRAAEGKVIVTE